MMYVYVLNESDEKRNFIIISQLGRVSVSEKERKTEISEKNIHGQDFIIGSPEKVIAIKKRTFISSIGLSP